MDKSLDNNTHNSQPPTKQGAGSLGEKVAGVANVVHGSGEIVRGHVLDLTECGRGTGSEIAAAGKAEFGRGSNRLGLSHKSAPAPTTSSGGNRAHTGAAPDSERAGPYAAAGVSTAAASDTRRAADPRHRTEKETVPTIVNDGGSARPEYEQRPTPQTTSPDPLRAGGAQYDTEEGQKTNGTFPRSQEKTSDTANDTDPTAQVGQREKSNAAIQRGVPE